MTECLYHLKTKKQIVVILTSTISQDQIKGRIDQIFNSVKRSQRSRFRKVTFHPIFDKKIW